tara:strand:+ start:54 stop:191 length:138 start_codon:yes stop_codon:yes gene_type:complete
MSAIAREQPSGCKIPKNIEALYSLIWKLSKKERRDLLVQYEIYSQ